MPEIAVEDRAVRTARLRLEGPRWRTLFAGLRHPGRFLGELIARIEDDRMLTQAAGMSYYFFLAVFPLLLFVLSLVSVLPVRGLEDWLLSSMAQFVPPEAFGSFEGTVRGILEQPRGGLLSLGAVLALWAASSGFTAVMEGLDVAYRVRDTRSWWRFRLTAIALTVALSGLMILAFVLAVFGWPLIAWAGSFLGPVAVPVLNGIRWVAVIAMISVVVAWIYYACPDVEQRWRWVTPGSLVFVLGFGVTSAAFSYYVSHFGSYDKTYGSLGAVIILLVWMYMLAFFLMLGGQVNALLEHASPAGKAPGERALPEAGERAARDVRASG